MASEGHPSGSHVPSQDVRFSIVMPAFCAADTIRQAIESILAQTFAQFELLVIDDCSHDATAAIVAEFAAGDGRVVLISQPVNRGAAACMNAGVRAARHEWIGIFDADAIAPATWLAQAAVIAAGAREQGVDAFGGGCDYFPPTNEFERVAYAFEADITAQAAETFDVTNPREPTIRGTNFFFTRQCFDVVGGFAEDIRAAYDRLFLCNAIERGCRVRFDPTLLVGHPLPGSTISEFLWRNCMIGQWRLVAAERSPILRRVYRPVWPAIITAASVGVATVSLLGMRLAIIVAAAGAGVVMATFFGKGLTHGLRPGTAIRYATLDAIKKVCTAGTYLLRLRPAKRDWKRR